MDNGSQDMTDIREKRHVGRKDVLALNFIRDSGPCTFRRHFRQGLRSHVLEVLDRRDVEKETRGVMRNGIRCYPKAKPLKMLRIFRRRFDRVSEVYDETRKFKIIVEYLGREYVAMSDEFIVDYRFQGKHDILLCGLQEYVEGAVLDPWNISRDLAAYDFTEPCAAKPGPDMSAMKETIIAQAVTFVDRVRRMVTEAGHIPDIAGVGNLIVDVSGLIRLVDINNVSEISFGPEIGLDEKGYPVCDKSAEALYLLERKLLGRAADTSDPIYKVFLDPARMAEVNEIDKSFHQTKNRRATL